MIYTKFTVILSYLFVGTIILFQNASNSGVAASDLNLFQALGQTGIFGTLSVLAGRYLLSQKNQYQKKFYDEINSKIELLEKFNNDKEEIRKAYDQKIEEIRSSYDQKIEEIINKTLHNTSK